MERMEFRARQWRALSGWVRQRAREASTWSGLGLIAVALGSDPLATHGIVQALSLILGGGLVTMGPPAPIGDAG